MVSGWVGLFWDREPAEMKGRTRDERLETRSQQLAAQEVEGMEVGGKRESIGLRGLYSRRETR
eukprot:1613907-Rhodomonas_salina.1